METLEDMMTAAQEEITRAEVEWEPRGRPPLLKTYIMESNNGQAKIEETDTVRFKQTPTDLPEVSILRLEYEGRRANFYLDATDKRFLVLYTNDLAEVTDKLYHRLVQSTTNKFDKVWLPTEVLSEISKISGNIFRGFGLRFTDRFSPEQAEEPINELSMTFAGTSSEEALDALSERETLRRSISYSMIKVRRGNSQGFVTNEIRFNGRLITKSGDSIDDHVSHVEMVRKIYKDLIEEIERNSIGTKKVGDRTLIEGQAFDLVLDRQIEDLDQFTDRLLRPNPFRLWGLRNKVFKNMRQVVAVDLHTGDPIDLEIAPSFIRIYLPRGACGNTVLRLYVNLQHAFDSAIRFNGEKTPKVAN